jgi:hypothetical protein
MRAWKRAGYTWNQATPIRYGVTICTSTAAF